MASGSVLNSMSFVEPTVNCRKLKTRLWPCDSFDDTHGRAFQKHNMHSR
jgi:hypothetical protein